MKPRRIMEMLLLAALWGGSFIFLRATVPEFGPIPVAQLRVLGAALCLLPLVVLRGEFGFVRREWKHLVVCGVLSYGLPFALIAYALQSLPSGLSSIFNASTPLWGAAVAWVWLGDRLSMSRVVGLVIGFAGVLGLAWVKADFHVDAGGHSSGLAILSLIGGTICYAVGVAYTKRYLSDVPPLAVAAGSQLGGVLVLAVPSIWLWPATPPSASAWHSMILLAVASTAFAYVLFYRLISSVGAANALATTFLVPAFAVLWGWIIFDETLTMQMIVGCLVIICGTVLAVGLFTFGKPLDPAQGRDSPAVREMASTKR